ncbi:unnamed protein product [Cuscuta europaea]|uniref:Uncharacterized protein n=1 Tax=Cuscuta europaea TaxID=41803 RepID=A0A9P1E803_CUSEU|nr:unnamed protein product [Cuscuta europaea]
MMKTVKNGATKLLEIPFADEQNNVITCTLFGEMINQYEAYKKSSTSPTILVLQCFRARNYQGGIYVSNVHDVSKLIVNGEHQDVMEFRERLPPPLLPVKKLLLLQPSHTHHNPLLMTSVMEMSDWKVLRTCLKLKRMVGTGHW